MTEAKIINYQLSIVNYFVPLHPLSKLAIATPQSYYRWESIGEMVEWSITTVLKTVVLRGTGGSNPSLSANIAENQQVTNLHPDLHPLLVNLGVILHPLFGVSLIDNMLKVLKF